MKHPVRKGTIFAVAAVLVTAVVSATAMAATARSNASSHPCVVAAGSGDQAFVRNFNPFNLGTSRDFTWGGIYENLIVTTAFGGGNQYNILAKSVAFTKDGKTLNISIVPNAVIIKTAVSESRAQAGIPSRICCTSPSSRPALDAS